MAILRNTQISGSLEVSGSLTIPGFQPPSGQLQTGSMFFSGTSLYVYSGTAWLTGSLS